MTYRLREVAVDVSILQSKRHSCPKTPATIEHVDGPKGANGRRLLFGVGKKSGIGIAAMQA